MPRPKGAALTHRRGVGSCVALGAVLVGSGCYTAQLDPDLGGVFACEGDDDDACPSGQACVNARCEDAEAVPTLFVLNPEDEASIERNEVIDPLMMGPAPGAPLQLLINIQGTLELVSANASTAHVFGEGYVKIFIDGEEDATVDADTIDPIDEIVIDGISDSTAVMVRVPPIAGPHRIVVQAFRNDGVAYDNPEATATRLFWLENAAGRRPFVAIKSPWPGTAFGLDTETIEIEIATNEPTFELVDPSSARQEGLGHAHLHYRDPFPDCVRDMRCDEGYLGVVGASSTGSIVLPQASEQDATLSVVLRHIDHTPYGFPFGCDPTEPLSPCAPIFETISVQRVGE